MRPDRLAFLALALSAACAGPEPAPERPSAVQRLAPGDRVADLYARHCALCHGAQGAGDGFATPYLFPPPRDFGTGSFRLVGTRNGAPSDEDLVAVLRRGMPGSAMPSFAWLAEADLLALARHVRALAARGLAERIGQELDLVGDPTGARDALAEAERRLTPGPALDLAQLDDEGAPERGRELYAASCAPCHGEDGRGAELAPHWTDDGSFAWARDFTAGVLKGGAAREALARRVLAGLPGTTMPATPLPEPGDLSALVDHVKGLIPAGAEDRLVQHRETLRAVRSQGALPDGPLAPGWSQAEEVDVVLAPMEWGGSAVLRASLAALHDGQSIAVRVRWSDARRDQLDALDEPFVDGASLALSSEAEPPAFGMGASEHPVNLWHWRADRMIDRAGVLDLLENPPHVLRDPLFGESRTDVAPVYLPAPSPDQPTDEVQSARAEGAGAVEHGARTHEVTAAADWHDGEWGLVFYRPLVAGVPGAVPLRAGQDAQLALALWNAAPPESLARKSITIWHRLVLDP